MTAKFEAFKAALEALCAEHQVKLGTIGYDEADITVCDMDDADERVTDLTDLTKGTPEESAALQSAREAHWKRLAEGNAERTRLHLEYIKSPDYLASMARITEEAKRTREQQLRISTDPADPAYIDDRPRKVWCNDVEILGWTIADEFRRCVITPAKVHNGSVRIERLTAGEGGSPLAATPHPGPYLLPNGTTLTLSGGVEFPMTMFVKGNDFVPVTLSDEQAAAVAGRVATPAEAPIDAGFSGVFVHVPDPKPEAPAFEVCPPATEGKEDRKITRPSAASFAAPSHTPKIKAKGRR